MTKLVGIRPIYGWGWSGVPGAPAEPEPFQVAVEERSPETGPVRNARGQVRSSGHPLDNRYVYLTSRHVEGDSHYSAVFFVDRPAISGPDWTWRKELDARIFASGFVEIDQPRVELKEDPR